MEEISKKVLAVLKFLWEYTDENRPATTSDIIKGVAEYGVNLERHALPEIYEDLLSMGIDVIFCKSSPNKYYIGSRQLELSEVKLLIDAVDTAGFISATQSKKLINRIIDLSEPSSRKELKRHVYSNQRPKSECKELFYNVDTIHRAINASNMIRFQYYEYKPTRSGQNAAEFLNGYKGYLVCDGYDGYNKLTDVRRCGCWAHARRKFLEAIPIDPETAKTSKAKEGYDRINEIFAIEGEMKKLSPDEKQKQRLEQIKPVLDGFYAWLETFTPSGKTKLEAAVQYVLNEKKYLYAFLEDPNIPVDNNTAERAVKPFVIGRKNWLFSASPKGAEASAVAYSVIQTALANNLNVRDYLTQIFAGITKLPFETE